MPMPIPMPIPIPIPMPMPMPMPIPIPLPLPIPSPLPTPLRLLGATSLLALLLALPAAARPGWSGNPDTSTDQGHTFVCEGQAKNEEDALAAAHGICNDKICKLCGVEVTSIVETKETLTGVDFQRKVVEQCHRVRRAETQVKRKSTDCEDASCTAWIEVWYPAAIQKEECASYTKEDFSDPAACEQDIEAFRRIEGRTAESFRRRAAALDAALLHCAKIDVRPTPAMLALDEKIKAGLDSFEYKSQGERREDSYDSRPYWAWYLTTDPALRQQIAESKTLLARFQLARDYVRSRALVFEVIEAVRAAGWDTPAGISRLAAAMEKAPTGTPYGGANVHFAALGTFYHAKTDTAPVGAVLRKLYDPATLDAGQQWSAALFYADDKKVTEEEWSWSFRAHQAHRCVNCLRALVVAPDHGPDPELRLKRFLQAYQASVGAFTGKNPEARAVTELTGYSDPGLVLAVEGRLPEAARAAFTWKFLREVLTRIDPRRTDPSAIPPFLARAVRQLAAEATPEDEGFCTGLAAEVEPLVKKGADPAPLDRAVCGCLTGPLRNRLSLVNRDDLLKHADARKLACTKGLPR